VFLSYAAAISQRPGAISAHFGANAGRTTNVGRVPDKEAAIWLHARHICAPFTSPRAHSARLRLPRAGEPRPHSLHRQDNLERSHYNATKHGDLTPSIKDHGFQRLSAPELLTPHPFQHAARPLKHFGEG
jgi:hypothetical protein